MGDSGSITPGAMSEEGEDSCPEADQFVDFTLADATADWQLALDGISMLLNNNWVASETHFQKYKDHSPLMNAGSSFVTFLQALMTFEDEKLAEAMKALQETESRCRKKSTNGNAEEQLQRQILVADSILHQAVLTFLNQDLSSYIKGGWFLRKAWKIYEKTYREIRDLYDSHNGLSSPTNNKIPKTGSSVSIGKDSSQLSKVTVARLLGAVSFGYGTFQLCISMVPPKLLKIIQFLGFEGDRDTGLAALEFSSHSYDMKAPLATLGLLWYHTVIRPFFALDGASVDAGVEEATIILERCEEEYPQSALFLFFKGRVKRLRSEIDESLSTYQTALDVCREQREIQLICLHEIGWCNLMKLNWAESLDCFARLKDDSRWSKCYYAYLAAVCQGAIGDVKGAAVSFKAVPSLVKRKNNQIEAFVQRRAESFKKTPVTREHCVLLALEVLYLWNAIPTCSSKDRKHMLDECSQQSNKKLFHLMCLIEGSLYKDEGDAEKAAQCYEEAIARHSGMKEDMHVAAFAKYELGILLCQQPETYQQGQKHLTEVKDHMKDYNFENRLNVRIHAALRRLKKEGTPL